MRRYMPFVLMFLVGGCCGSVCCAQSIDRRTGDTYTSTAIADEAASDTTQPQAVEVVLPPEPSITFERSVASGEGGLVRSTVPTTERWLVSEDWCVNCPAAKARFKAAGNDASHIITIAQAKSDHGITVTGIPYEFTTRSIREVLNPPTYRSATSMSVTLDGSSMPTKSAILKHLRGGGPHQGKHWQSWYLESWNTQQLYALHDDDHAGKVPTFEPESSVIATVANADGTAETFAAVLSQHLMQSSGQVENESYPVGGLFDFSITVDQSWKDFGQRILSAQKISFDAAGLTVDWTGASRSLTVEPNKITINPPVKVSVSKWVFAYSAGLKSVAFADGMESVKFELSGAPDLTVRLVTK